MSKTGHPLRTIRAATPHPSQAAFAAFLGVPVSVVQAVESGKAKMTLRLASHIQETTGADEMELLCGREGRALNLSGRQYTAESFAAWVSSHQQLEARRKRESTQATQRNAWARYLESAGSSVNGSAPSMEDIVAVEDLLIPWQSCEFASAAAGSWKRLPEGLLRLTGWSQDIALPADTRLTLAVQSAPSWNPEGPPPGLSAANAELFPPCYFTVAAGSGGCRVAAAFWQAVCREHAIDATSGRPLHQSPTGSWRGFFRRQGEQCEPHAVFAGLETGETAPFLNGLFSKQGILSGPAGDTLAERTLEFIGAHSEDAGSPAGILLFASLEGGTASALSTLLLTRIRARHPTVPVMVAGVLPLEGISQVVTAPWHLALAMQAIRRYASAAVLFSNDLLLHQAAKVWDLPSPGYAEANLLIAECLSALTAPLRFGGVDTPPVDLAALIECFPQKAQACPPEITAQCWPLASLEDRRLKTMTLPRLVQGTLSTAMQTPLTAFDSPGLGVFLRVRPFPDPEWTAGAGPVAIKHSGRISTGLHESATVFASSPVIRRTLRRFAKQARELWKPDNSAACAELGVTPEEMRKAVEELAL